MNRNAIVPSYFIPELNAEIIDDQQFTTWLEGRTPAGRWCDISDLVCTLFILMLQPRLLWIARSSVLMVGSLLLSNKLCFAWVIFSERLSWEELYPRGLLPFRNTRSFRQMQISDGLSRVALNRTSNLP